MLSASIATASTVELKVDTESISSNLILKSLPIAPVIALVPEAERSTAPSPAAAPLILPVKVVLPEPAVKLKSEVPLVAVSSRTKEAPTPPAVVPSISKVDNTALFVSPVTVTVPPTVVKTPSLVTVKAPAPPARFVTLKLPAPDVTNDATLAESAPAPRVKVKYLLYLL